MAGVFLILAYIYFDEMSSSNCKFVNLFTH